MSKYSTSMKIHDTTWDEEFQRYIKSPEEFEAVNSNTTKELLNEACVSFKEFLSSLPLDIGKYDFIDFGSGVGDITSELKHKFKKIYSVEPSESGIKLQKERFRNDTNIEIIQAYGEDFLDNFKPNNPVIFWTGTVLLHIPTDVVKRILERVNNFPEYSAINLSELYTRFFARESRMHYARTKRFYKNELSTYNVKFLNTKTIIRFQRKGIHAYK